MCVLAAVSRAGYYRFLLPQADTDEEESRLRDAIQRAAIESRHYGYRITRALKAQGWEVNHKRVARLMHEDISSPFANAASSRRQPTADMISKWRLTWLAG